MKDQLNDISLTGASLSGTVYGKTCLECSQLARASAREYFDDRAFAVTTLAAFEVRTNGDVLLHYEASFTAVAE